LLYNPGVKEFELLDRIRARLPENPAGVLIGSGDDCAHLDSGGQRLLLTTDLLVAGVHFEHPGATPEQIGYKAVAVSLSDIAAMGAQPWTLVSGYGMPAGLPEDFGDRLLAGMLEAAAPHGVSLVGGDIVRSPTLFLSVTMIGRDICGQVVTRGGARPGDLLLVTGELGGSILGRHLRPVARVAEGLILNRDFGVTAMIDLSDGLAGDLQHLTRDSEVGAEIDSARLPISAAARELAAKSGKSAIEHALCDGEDFELLLACPPAAAEQLLSAPPFETPLTRIGRVLPAEAGLLLIDADGRRKPLALGGYEHGDLLA